jgi:hypothetical protein
VLKFEKKSIAKRLIGVVEAVGLVVQARAAFHPIHRT